MFAGRYTKTDPRTAEWPVDDRVVRLREWGTDIICVLPPPPVNEWLVGSDDTCALRLEDPSGRVSRQHAQLIRGQATWILRDLNSKNGIKIDGARLTDTTTLEPGVEIGIGGLTLIAESGRSVVLRQFLSRILGWRSERTEVVDHALRAVRMAATRRMELVVCGEGDLVPLARSIHQHALGDRPFVVCDPRRRAGKATVRSAENYRSAAQALAAAEGGSLCVRSHRLPRDFAEVAVALRKPDARTQLIVCARARDDCAPYLAVPIDVPPLASRPAEIDRIISEYAEDAIAQLETSRTSFRAADRAWVRTYSASSLPDIEKGTLRLIALRDSRTLTRAAARLGMAAVSLSRWIGRRSLPMELGE